MGIDAGFDMVPRLSTGATDRHNWDTFIRIIKDMYKDDTQVEIKPNYIEFNAGEHPMLPFEGHKFLRFSSKISGSCANVEIYIDTVRRVAEVHFGSRVKYWNEIADPCGVYDWKLVHESFRSYEQRDEPEPIASIAQLITGTDPIQNIGIPLFEIAKIPGKGRGLIARLNIAKGTRILCEKPFFTVASMSPNVLEPIIAKRLRAISKDAQRQFLSLHNNYPGKHPFSGIFKTNALPCGPDSPVGGVYPTICLINHSCIPNSHNNWNDDTDHETIHANRLIKAGEEITIAYNQEGDTATRRAWLTNTFGFDCNCPACSRSASEIRVSDARRLRMKKLDDDIGNGDRMVRRPKDSLKDCHELLKLLKEEYDGCAVVLEARAYYDAFQVVITHGDQARATGFEELEDEENDDTKGTGCCEL
ncbi:SET domain-containing protein [Massarina eburnea CBS 473.64]|uniref:SET domain-containing protein n=1 Tax=Massarina eburnea CBS 473.64 TaxID=1395130 RepID=A0A6A6S6E6_9PLEO|nr:SET domain-containing protein [Massarina eburnea CBS 473.64]